MPTYDCAVAKIAVQLVSGATCLGMRRAPVPFPLSKTNVAVQRVAGFLLPGEIALLFCIVSI
jgi:hypothetical protein